MRRRYRRWNSARRGSRQLIDDGGDHRIEICDLVMQFDVSTSEGFEGDAIGHLHITISSQAGPPRGQRADELATHLAVTAVLRQHPQRFHHSVPTWRRDGSLACEGGMGGVLSVEIVVLASPAPVLPVRSRDLEDRNPRLLHKAQEACAVTDGRLHSDARCRSPSEHIQAGICR